MHTHIKYFCIKLIWNKSNKHTHTRSYFVWIYLFVFFFDSRCVFLRSITMPCAFSFFFSMTLAGNGYSRFVKWNGLEVCACVCVFLVFFCAIKSQIHTDGVRIIRFVVAVVHWLVWFISNSIVFIGVFFSFSSFRAVWWYSGSLTFSLSIVCCIVLTLLLFLTLPLTVSSSVSRTLCVY